MKLNVKAFALAIGIVWAGGCLFMGLTATVCSWAKPFVDVFGMMYIGYTATVVGALIGTVWGFVDAAIGGAVFAWLYNVLAVRLAK
ncbi:MAG: bacteriophage holin [Candidatus Omnitrophica bacterium]|nr:bacteriophage holin [Candidatus Omnitrophota bacterium]